MRPELAFAAAIAAASATAGTPGALAGSGSNGVTDGPAAHQNWVLQCQGCHRPDATGSPGTTPTMAGVVGKVMSVPGGREYLVRVPGVATAPLGDAELAELLNWMLHRFDAGNLPSDFMPYTAAEVGRLRAVPLRVEAPQVRAMLFKEIKTDSYR